MKKILFFPFGNINTPSSRVRCFYVAEELKRRGFKVKVCGRKTSKGVLGVMKKFASGLKHLFWCDILFFNKAAHWSTYVLLKSAKLMGKKVVFDLDDSEFLRNNWFNAFLQEADAVFAGSHFIIEHARKLNKNVFFIPTTVNIKQYAVKNHRKKKTVVIGWTGTSGNVKYLNIVKNSVKKLSEKYDIRFGIITDIENADIPRFENINLQLIPWTVESANKNILKFDIGLMPLENTDWEKGKCAFKAIEYMASNIPAVVSGVGENNYLINNGINGFIANTEDEWYDALEKLIIDVNLRKKIGKTGRNTVLENYELTMACNKIMKVLKLLKC